VHSLSEVAAQAEHRFSTVLSFFAGLDF